MSLKKLIRIGILALLFIVPVSAQAQQEAKKDSPATKREKRKKAKATWKEQRETKMGNDKAIKDHHKRLQTKKTRKLMKKTRKLADKNRPSRRRK